MGSQERRPWEVYIGVELLFTIIVVAVYRTDILGVFIKAPLEISFSKDNFTVFPMNYLQIWAVIPFLLRLTVFQFYDLQKFVDFFLFLNSSFFLSLQFIRLVSYRLKGTHPYDYLWLPALFGTAIISFNPVFVDLFYKFGVASLAIMNFSLYFLMQSIRTIDRINWFLYIVFASFIFLLAYNAYPLILIFTVSLIFLLVMPFAFFTGKKGKFTLSFFVFILLIGLFDPSIISILHVISIGGAQSQEPLFHVVNLVYYTMNTNNVMISLSGMDTFNVPTNLFYNEVLSLILISVVFALFFFSTEFRKLKIVRYLISIYVVVELLNFYAFNNFTFANYLIYYIVSAHLVTYNHLGIFLTAMDSDRLILIDFWYLLASLLALTSYSLLKGNPSVGRERRQNKPDTRIKLMGRVTTPSGRNKRLAIQIIFALIILIFASLQFSGYSNNFVNGTVKSTAYQYVSNSANLNYNSFLFFQNINFQSNYIYPITNAPVSTNYGFYQNVNNIFNSPDFSYFYHTFPANTYIYNVSTNSVVNGTKFLNSYTGYIQNYNSTNLITGTPVFVIGSQQAYENFIIKNSTAYINGTGTDITNLSDRPISYLPISQRDLESINKGDLLSVSISAKINSSQRGGYLIGLAGNSSVPFDYGISNPFYGVGTRLAGNTTYLNIQYTNSSVWHVLSTIPIGKKATNFTFNIYISKTKGTYQIYEDILNNWFTAPLGNSQSAFRYLTFQAHGAPLSNISLNVNLSNLKKNNLPNFIPIFYDSYFNNLTSFFHAMDSSPYVLFVPNYGFGDLVQSYLVWSNSSISVNPSAYAVDFPNKGWYQVFNTNSPQGAYYSEGIPESILPIQSGYGDYRGYADSIVRNSTLTVPAKILNNESLSVNVLFSPLGGTLSFLIGSQTININTYSNSSFYKWISFKSNENAKDLTIENVNGVQSINAINIYDDNEYIKALAVLNDSLNGKLGIGDQIKINAMTYKIYGNYSIGSNKNKFGLYSQTAGKLITVLPSDVNYAVIVKTSGATTFIEPVWGNFMGILYNLSIKGAHSIIISTDSSSNQGYFLYSPPFIGLMVVLGRYIYSNRPRRTPLKSRF